MLSPSLSVTAGTLVIAIVGVFAIASPHEQDHRAGMSAETNGAGAVPVEVTGTGYGGNCGGGTFEEDGIIVRQYGALCEPTYQWSDPRLNGNVTWESNQDRYVDGSLLTIERMAISIENEDGAWRMRPSVVVAFPGSPRDVGPEVWVLDGEGGYDGLTAVLSVNHYDPHGFIIDGDLPRAPENASSK
jgi:hypothetical protein